MGLKRKKYEWMRKCCVLRSSMTQLNTNRTSIYIENEGEISGKENVQLVVLFVYIFSGNLGRWKWGDYDKNVK